MLNAIAKAAEDLKLPKEDDYSSYRLHCDLFVSGIERILLVSVTILAILYWYIHAILTGCPKSINDLLPNPSLGDFQVHRIDRSSRVRSAMDDFKAYWTTTFCIVQTWEDTKA